MILHIDTETGWRGGERQLLLLAEGLKKKKIPQLVLGKPGSALEKRCSDHNLPFYALEMRGEWDLASVKAIRSLVREKKIRLIHTHTAKAHTLALFAKSKLPQIKLVVSRRVDFSIRKNLFSIWKYKSKRNDLFLTVSNKIREILLRDGVDPAKTVTVHSGIDFSFAKKLPDPARYKKEFSIKKDTIVIGNVAALVDHKDQKTLLKALSALDPSKNFKLLVVGEGELRKELEDLSATLGISDKVVFTGYREDVPDILSVFDIFTLTSKEEGLGTSVLDAMAVGLPVVATKGGGIGEMLTHESGAFLAEVGDVDALSKYYEILIDDAKLRKTFGIFNREAVKRFSIKNTIRKTELAYYSFLGEELFGEKE
ncbi:glycosyltransferase [Leptospira gomenensis]|uniref:Glycosyltransferase n=1 Tax=Leptospira gomenensis TaxID=2484974 RepID=A0A5F1YAW7_9LEPT|nr:glycosyltransferase [Leptospira gomenensis]TGK32789.1 glycosyltransferase [Leptospira gomenensis]TGK37210.1 glycosyltransferase [Leptospira gomenensis]TGK39948.1 glycosyltransferase [Leptospira gomenensis]TGK58074.1 glycosyltransferase [Leptospira gomenensis]